MNKELSQALRLIYEEVDAEFPDKSTAFILEVAAERARIRRVKRDCGCGDIAESLFDAPQSNERTTT